MNTVYVVFHVYPYADEVLGVFSTDKKAQAWLDTHREKYEEYKIRSFVVDTPGQTSWDYTV